MSRSLINEMGMDSEGFEMRFGDNNYFEALKKLKNNEINKNLRDEELNSLIIDSDYSTMFMTF